MKKCEYLVNKFGGAFENTDERELDDELRLFRQNLHCLENFEQVYQIVTGRTIDTKEIREKAIKQVQDCY